jgi:hypothetical protein
MFSFFFFASNSVLLLERRQLDTLLSFHSSFCLLQRTVKPVLLCPILFCSVLFPAKESSVSIMGAAFGGTSPHPRLGMGG